MTNLLQQIVERKRREVEEAKSRMGLEKILARAAEADAPRNFFQQITTRRGPRSTNVIAEIKRKSPSAGWLREEYRSDEDRGEDASGLVAQASRLCTDGTPVPPNAADGFPTPFDPAPIAKAYHRAGAAAISCLTDREGFGGDLDYIRRIRNRVPLPVLRKDFIIDPWQLYESRAASADAVLLIADILTEGELVDLMILTTELRMTALVEVHDVETLLRVRPHIGFPHPGYMLLGINNRDLRTMRTDLNHTLRLIDMVEQRDIVVSESGITTPDDLRRLRMAGVRIVLVGEHLMRAEDPGAALEELLREPT